MTLAWHLGVALVLASVQQETASRPDIVGRVVGVFEDGSTTLVRLAPPPGASLPGSRERHVYLQGKTRVKWRSVPRRDRKLAPGLIAHVWLAADSEDLAARVRFDRDDRAFRLSAFVPSIFPDADLTMEAGMFTIKGRRACLAGCGL